MSKKGKSDTTPASDKLTHSPFAALATQELKLGQATAAPAPPQAAPPAAAPAKAKKSRGRLVLRRETKHRGGKAVIVVTGIELIAELNEQATDALAKQLKQTLGCGGTVERSAGRTEIVLQGDRAAKVAELLRAQGYRVDGVTT